MLNLKIVIRLLERAGCSLSIHIEGKFSDVVAHKYYNDIINSEINQGLKKETR